MGTNCSQKPDHESQIRPLIGLAPDEVAAAWTRAIEKARGRKVRAAHVQSAVKDLNLQPAAPPEKAERQRLSSQRRQVVLPGKEDEILFGGLAVFGLAALLVLYAYHKGLFDQNQNGIPDFLERDRQTKI